MNQLIYRLLSGRAGAKFELRILMRQTAIAFGADPPKTASLSALELLNEYARFTADAAVHVIQNGQNSEQLHQRLYQMTFRLGSRLRRWLKPQDEKDCLAILVMLYQNIGITIREEKPGKFCVHKCYFSTFYTPEVCAVISAIDAGIFAGIYQSGTLVFQKRITEGQDVCIADLRSEERNG